MPSAFILSTSTVVDPDVHALRAGNITYVCFIKDMSMVWRGNVIVQLVDEHLDRLSQIKPNNDTNVSGLLPFEFVSVLTESDMLFKTNGLQTLEVKDVNKLNDAIAQHHMFFFIASASSRC